MIENSMVIGAQDAYDELCREDPAAEALWDARVIEFQRELLNSLAATPADHDWDDLAVLVYEDDEFPAALFEALHSNPELKISKIIRRHAEKMAEQWREDNQ